MGYDPSHNDWQPDAAVVADQIFATWRRADSSKFCIGLVAINPFLNELCIASDELVVFVDSVIIPFTQCFAQWACVARILFFVNASSFLVLG
jgi:hypothetical protein